MRETIRLIRGVLVSLAALIALLAPPTVVLLAAPTAQAQECQKCPSGCTREAGSCACECDNGKAEKGKGAADKAAEEDGDEAKKRAKKDNKKTEKEGAVGDKK